MARGGERRGDGLAMALGEHAGSRGTRAREGKRDRESVSESGTARTAEGEEGRGEMERAAPNVAEQMRATCEGARERWPREQGKRSWVGGGNATVWLGFTAAFSSVRLFVRQPDGRAHVYIAPDIRVINFAC